jgi:hypothetical protein
MFDAIPVDAISVDAFSFVVLAVDVIAFIALAVLFFGPRRALRDGSLYTAKGPGRSSGRLRGLASPSELCGSSSADAKCEARRSLNPVAFRR